MNSAEIGILISVVAAVIVAAIVLLRKRRSHNLREQFGPEYDRVVREEGNVNKGERLLEFRQNHRKTLSLRPLSAEDQAHFDTRWKEVQNRFVDDPSAAVAGADSLIIAVMQTRGYPADDFTQLAADISVDHPMVVAHYRAAHDIALRHTPGQASTEDLRQAIVHYRVLFSELLEKRHSQPLRKEV